jgi:hypothetical protein
MEASVMNELAKYLLIFLSLTLVYSVLLMVGGNKIFKKANQKELTIYYPILNLFTMLDVTETSIFLGILFFVPGINVIAISIMLYRLGMVFNKGTAFNIGLVLLPFIFYPLLAFSNANYKVKNQSGLESISKVNNIMLMTQAELDKLNENLDKTEEPEVDSIFKGTLQTTEEVAPYKAVKIDLLGTNKTPDSKTDEVISAKKDDDNKDENIEYVDL